MFQMKKIQKKCGLLTFGEKTVELQENRGVADFNSASLRHAQQRTLVIYQRLITAAHA